MCLCKAQVKAGGLMAIDTNDILMLSVPAHHSPPNLFLLSTLRSVCECLCVSVCVHLFSIYCLSIHHPDRYPLTLSDWDIAALGLKMLYLPKWRAGETVLYSESAAVRKKKKDISVLLPSFALMKLSQPNKRKGFYFFFFYLIFTDNIAGHKSKYKYDGFNVNLSNLPYSGFEWEVYGLSNISQMFCGLRFWLLL